MNTSEPDPATEKARDRVLAHILNMFKVLLDEYLMDQTEITLETRFYDDLELESVDLVTFGGLLRERYGPRVNFAEYLAEMEFEEILELTVGGIVEYVLRCLDTTQGE